MFYKSASDLTKAEKTTRKAEFKLRRKSKKRNAVERSKFLIRIRKK